MKCPCPSTVNVGSIVSVRLSYFQGGKPRHFKIWREQMLCLLESQDVVGFVKGEIPQPPVDSDDHKAWRRTDKLVKGWILGCMEEHVADDVWEKETAKEVWSELEDIFIVKEKEEKDAHVESRRCSKLYNAALRGDWENAENLFAELEHGVATHIGRASETALHVAVMDTEDDVFWKKMLERMSSEEVALKDCDGDTALHVAAMVGNLEAAKALVNKIPGLVNDLNHSNDPPVLHAALFRRRETLLYLIPESQRTDPGLFEGQQGFNLLCTVITSEYFDVALELVTKHPDLARFVPKKDGDCALSVVAAMSSVFPTEETSWWHLNIFHMGKKLECAIWKVMGRLVPPLGKMRKKKADQVKALELVEKLCEEMQSLSKKEAGDMFLQSILVAAENGISEIVEVILCVHPSAAFARDEIGRHVYLLAAENRFEKLFSIINTPILGHVKHGIFDIPDIEDNNMLHVCGLVAPPHILNRIPGAALQMQRELQWFEAMKDYVDSGSRTSKNRDGHTPEMLFTKEHKHLKEAGEKWMKETASACNIAAALIATVMFAAAFTLPGGLKQDKGLPVFLDKDVSKLKPWATVAFKVFAVSDAISLFSAITSLLTFLSILTSRYAEQDFLRALPKRLALGLLTLFISITFMLAAFGATMYLIFLNQLSWFLIPVAAFAALPVATFVLLQFPLLAVVVASTYTTHLFGKTKTPQLKKTKRPNH